LTDVFIPALLIENFHIKPNDYEELTDREIVELYLYPRNQKGELLPPEEDDRFGDSSDDSLEGQLKLLKRIESALGKDVRGLAAAEAKLRKKYGQGE
jgi:hypothetical protein